jgi:signal transduction histidine kinase
MESDSPSPTPAQKESIAQILQAGWHLLKLINEILDLAKVESRQVPLAEGPVSLADVMLECQGMIEPQAHERGIKVSFPKAAWSTYPGRSVRLKQASSTAFQRD